MLTIPGHGVKPFILALQRKCAIRTGKTHIGRKEEKQEKRARARKKRQRSEVDVARPESTHVAPELWSSFGWSYMDTALRGCQKGSANCFFMHTSLALFFFIFFFPSANGAQLRLGVCFDFHLSFFFFSCFFTAQRSWEYSEYIDESTVPAYHIRSLGL